MNELPRFVIPLLILLAVGMAGLLLAWLIRYVGGSREKQARDDGASLADAYPGAGTDSRSEQGHLLCVVRREDGQVAVMVEGKPYDRLRDIKDPAVGRLAVEAVKGVLLFAEDLLPSSAKRSLRSGQKPAKPSRQAVVATELGRQSVPPSPRQLVDEIDELVQARIRELPDLVEPGVRLRQDTAGGLVIFVGNDRYDSLDKIPDKKVQALIREAIQEWESR